MELREKNILITGIALIVITVTLFSFTYNPSRDTQNPVVLGVEVNSFTHIPIEEFKEKVDSKGVILVDVRSSEEYNSGHIENAVNVNIEDNFSENMNGFPKDRTYFIYSRNDNRSSEAIEIMNELGFKSVVALEGGIESWTDSNYPLEISL